MKNNFLQCKVTFEFLQLMYFSIIFYFNNNNLKLCQQLQPSIGYVCHARSKVFEALHLSIADTLTNEFILFISEFNVVHRSEKIWQRL